MHLRWHLPTTFSIDSLFFDSIVIKYICFTFITQLTSICSDNTIRKFVVFGNEITIEGCGIPHTNIVQSCLFFKCVRQRFNFIFSIIIRIFHHMLVKQSKTELDSHWEVLRRISFLLILHFVYFFGGWLHQMLSAAF